MRQNNNRLGLAVGANLKRAIKESPWRTQEKFAEVFRADERTVRRWCKGEIDKMSLVEQLSEFLGIDVFSLLSL